MVIYEQNWSSTVLSYCTDQTEFSEYSPTARMMKHMTTSANENKIIPLSYKIGKRNCQKQIGGTISNDSALDWTWIQW